MSDRSRDRQRSVGNLLVGLFVLMFAPVAAADLITVGSPPGVYAYETIQEAIDAASDGDEILVAPGVYFETIDFGGKAVRLRSASGPDATIIDGQQAGTVVTCNSGEGRGTVLQGFTITGGTGTGDLGGGMIIHFSSPTVIDCTFRENVAGLGAGVHVHHGSDPRIHRCRFIENFAPAGGAGLAIFESTARVTNSVFRGNTADSFAGLLVGIDTPNVQVVNCVFFENAAVRHGGGAVDGSNTSFINCTFAYNTAAPPGVEPWGGAGLVLGSDGTTIVNCIFWGNEPDQIRVEVGEPPLVMFSDIQGGWRGTGNLDADPLFVQPGLGDLRLAFDSPCLDAGDNSFVPPSISSDVAGSTRIQNGTVDMGAYEGAFPPLPPADGDDDLDPGDIVILVPAGGPLDPLQNPAAIVANISGPENASIVVTQVPDNEHSGAGGYSELSWILEFDTTLAAGELFMQVMIPFVTGDLDGANPLDVDLTIYDPAADQWGLAVAANTVNSPGHGTPVGDRFAVEGDTLPAFSIELGDYGVFFNPSTGQGVAWANVDHAGDFALGIALCPADLAGRPDGIVDVHDLAALLDDSDGAPSMTDLLLILDAWGACP